MNIEAIIIIILVGSFLVLTFYTIGIYNNLVNVRNRLEDQFEQIDFGFAKIINLIPELINVIKKNAKHEEKLLNEVKITNGKFMDAKSINEKIKAIEKLIVLIERLCMLEDTYPELKKNVKFTSIKKELLDIEDMINYASSFYNDAVHNYNSLRKQFPTNIVAKIFRFKDINTFTSNESKKNLV